MGLTPIGVKLARFLNPNRVDIGSIKANGYAPRMRHVISETRCPYGRGSNMHALRVVTLFSVYLALASWSPVARVGGLRGAVRLTFSLTVAMLASTHLFTLLP